MRRPFQLLHMLNSGASLADSGIQTISYFLFSSFPLLMTARVNHDERSCLFARFWNLPGLRSWKRDAFVIANWLPLFMKYNFVFPSIIDTLVQVITGLAPQTLLKSFDRFGVKDRLRRQHRADYYRSLRMFCPRTFKSCQPVKCDCSTNSFPLLNLWLTDMFLALVSLRFRGSQSLFDLFIELGRVKTTRIISCVPSSLERQHDDRSALVNTVLKV